MPRNLLSLLAAAVSVVGFVAWLSLSDPEPETPPAAAAPEPLAAASATREAASSEAPTDEPTAYGGSVAPCAVPLFWHLAEVDARFGLAPGDASAAVARAAESWERAVGRPLFVQSADSGIAIRFVYDQRQAAAIERQRLERNLAAVDQRLFDERRAIEERARAFDVRAALYEASVRELERRSAAHADSVRRWNASGGAPPAVAADLQAASDALDREQLELRRIADDLEETRRALQADADALNGRLDERERRLGELQGTLSERRVESGMYRELVGRSQGRVVAFRRAIDIYRFETREDLWLVVAHELGHALGLGHALSAGAVMSEEHRRLDTVLGTIQRDDVALLGARCPGLVSGLPRP